MKLLVLSNGHGEDVIAMRIIEQLLEEGDHPSIACLPLVGKGYAYNSLNIPMVTKPRSMPSGGFIYMDKKQFWKDFRSGLMPLLFSQYRAIKEWSKKGGFILAVGDILPLLFAWCSGANYAFVATAKSEYHLRDEDGWLLDTSSLERRWGSIYYPWERWLMSHPRCRGVFPRDSITSQVLKQYKIPVFDLGNPMMDGIIINSEQSPISLEEDHPPFIILLLPGSRSPEAENNWQLILEALEHIIQLPSYSFLFLAAIAPSLNLEPFEEKLLNKDWDKKESSSEIDKACLVSTCFTKKNTKLILSQNAFAKCLTLSELAIAMAGTATEQFVGLGKPAIALVGEGPQFTEKFAKQQGRLLGLSLIITYKPEEVAIELQKLLKNPDFWQLIVENGQKRLGPSGASTRIAKCLKQWLE